MTKTELKATFNQAKRIIGPCRVDLCRDIEGQYTEIDRRAIEAAFETKHWGRTDGFR